MYSVKGGWIGQTFALAAGNESGGKKSRIRLSKEKRKTMIESFIKRYQSSNNGNFPSLNLTHKEVGGSFYTVREIVREIIQENRVLGPGQVSSEEQNIDVMTVNYPLGSIASEPQGLFFEKANEMNGFSRRNGKEAVVLNVNNNGQFTKQFDSDAVQSSTENSMGVGEDVDGSLASENVVIFDHSEEASSVTPLNSHGKILNVNEADNVHFVNNMQTSGTSEEPGKLLIEADRESEQMGAVQDKLILPIEEVKVEAFPSRPIIGVDDDSSSSSANLKSFEENLNDLDDSTVVLDEVSSIVDLAEGVDSSEVSVSGDSGGSPDMMIQHAEINNTVNQHGEVNLKNDSEDISYSLPIKDDTAIPYNGLKQVSPHGDSASKTIEQNFQSMNASKGASYSGSSNITSGNNGKEATVATDYDLKRDDRAKVGSSPLDRIDLESWNASKQETNPLLALFKSFVDAFVRFWSE